MEGGDHRAKQFRPGIISDHTDGDHLDCCLDEVLEEYPDKDLNKSLIERLHDLEPIGSSGLAKPIASNEQHRTVRFVRFVRFDWRVHLRITSGI